MHWLIGEWAIRICSPVRKSKSLRACLWRKYLIHLSPWLILFLLSWGQHVCFITCFLPWCSALPEDYSNGTKSAWIETFENMSQNKFPFKYLSQRKLTGKANTHAQSACYFQSEYLYDDCIKASNRWYNIVWGWNASCPYFLYYSKGKLEDTVLRMWDGIFHCDSQYS